MKVSESTEGLASEVGEVLFPKDLLTFERATVHELKKDLDFTVVIKHVMALDHVRVIHIAKDLDLSTDLASHYLVVVPIDHLQRVDLTGRAMDHLVYGAAGSASDSTDSLEFREMEMGLTRRTISTIIVAAIVVIAMVMVLVGSAG